MIQLLKMSGAWDMRTGLVSVTFRKLPPPEIIKLVKEAGLTGIEWGGDVHCPPEDLEKVKAVSKLTRENGLEVISYGSYYCAGRDENFTAVAAAAVILRTKTIRIWAGHTGSLETDKDTRLIITKDIQRIADEAAEQGLNIAFEYHSRTLTDTLESTLDLLQSAERDNVFTYWQSPEGLTADENVKTIQQLVNAKKLCNLHVQAVPGSERLPLSDGAEAWKRYLSAAAPTNPALLLEFVKNDDPEQFLQDARTLRGWL
jgi:sugar phosphate isomerase/epimerase